MAGLGHLIDRLMFLHSWKSVLFNPLRKSEIADIVKQLNEIELDGRVVQETEKVVHRSPFRARVPSDEDLWKKEVQEGVARVYW